MIKWRILRWGQYPRFYGWALSVIVSVLIRGWLRERFDTEEGTVATEARCCTSGFEDGRMGHRQGIQGMHL